jgi:hypothetical protein
LRITTVVTSSPATSPSSRSARSAPSLDSERLTRGARLTRGPACLSLFVRACVDRRVHLAVQRLELKRIFEIDFQKMYKCFGKIVTCSF